MARLAVGGQLLRPSYLINHDPVEDKRDAPPSHILHYLCEQVGIKGEITLKPYFVPTAGEMEWGATYADCIAIQSGSTNSRWVLLNQQWDPERFRGVAESLMYSHRVVQIGHTNDKAIPCHIDLHGRTTLRQLAAVLAHSRLFVGLIGMPMHLAGRSSAPRLSSMGAENGLSSRGIHANFNIFSDIECAPCWRDNRCELERRCMSMIAEDSVIAAVRAMLDRPRNPLAIDTAFI